MKLLDTIKRAFRKWRFRSAITGKWVSKDHAKANPDSTVRERV